MGKNLSDLLRKSLDQDQLNLIQRVTGQAEAQNMPAYLVGGPVRDLLMQRPLTDFDIVVEGDAIKLARALVKAHGGEATTHPKFGTARWHTDRAGLDLITARSEVYEQRGALPTVKFSSIGDDLLRRDFTVNSMAIRLDGDQFGVLLDPLGGQDDLAHQLIRVLHARSFLDDPTRMLRAVRYEVRYVFAIDPGTLQLINADSRSVLGRLSGERLRHEFDMIFEEESPSKTLSRLAELDLLRPIDSRLSTVNPQLPTINEPPSQWGEFKTADILALRQSLGWIEWLMDLSPAEIDALAERLSFPAALTRAARGASSLLAELPTLAGSKPSRLTEHLDDMPALAVYAVFLSTRESVLKEYLANWRHVRPYTTGDDLKARGLPPGPEYQKILSRLRAARLDNGILTLEDETILLEKILKGE